MDPTKILATKTNEDGVSVSVYEILENDDGGNKISEHKLPFGVLESVEQTYVSI